MTTLTWTGAGGTNGAAFTTANSGGASGDALVITLAGAATATCNTTNPSITGHKWLRLQAAAGGTDRARAYHAYPTAGQLSERFYFRLGSDPTTAATVFAFIDDSGSFSQVVGLRLSTVSGARHLQLFDGAAGLLKDYGTITYGTTGTDEYYADINVTKGTTTSNGKVQCSIYDETGTLVDTFSSTTANTGIVNYIRTQWGGATGILQDLYVSTIQGNNDSPAALIGPGGAAVAPVATMMARPAPQAPGTVTGTCVFTSSTGTISSTSITILTSPGDGGAPPDNPTVSKSDSGINTATCTTTFTFTGAPGRYLVRGNCVDNGALSSNNSDVYVDVYAPSGADVQPYREISGTDTIVGGAANEIATWTDGNTATYTETAAAPVAALEKVEFCSFGPGPITFKIGGYQSPSSPSITITPTAKLADGTTNLPGTPTTFGAPTAVAETSFTVTNSDTVAPPGAARAALQLWISATQ